MAKTKKQVLCVAKLPDISKLKVSRKDIMDGETRDAEMCAIALTVRRALGDVEITEVSIGGRDSYVEVRVPFKLPAMPVPQVCVGGKLVPMPDLAGEQQNSSTRLIRLNLTLPKAAVKFISDFDRTDEEEDSAKARRQLKPIAFKAKVSVDDLGDSY